MIQRGIVIPEYQEVTESQESSLPEKAVSDSPVSQEEDGTEGR
jgi:hypothetical protein